MNYLIVANGPFLSKKLINELAKKSDVIIALDGACNKLARIGIMPHIILGDFDSIEEEEMTLWGIKRLLKEVDEGSAPYLGKYNIKIVPAKDQNLTDLMKAIRYCDKHEATSINIICAIGSDRMDHTISNVRDLRAEYKINRIIRLYTDIQMLTFAKNQTIIIQGRSGDYCGIVSAPAGIFTSEGLVYNGIDYKLEFGFNESTSNQLATPIATVHVIGEALVIHPPQLKSQREFLMMSYKERLLCLISDQHNILYQFTAGELRHVQVIQRLVYDKLNIFNMNDLVFKKLDEGELFYLSHDKNDVYNEKNISSNDKVLVSINDKQFKIFNMFKNIKKEDFIKEDIYKIITFIKEIYSENIAYYI